jgi:hypothetical protein
MSSSIIICYAILKSPKYELAWHVFDYHRFCNLGAFRHHGRFIFDN